MSDKKFHLYEAKLFDVFDFYTRYYPIPPGRHYIGQPEWIVDRDQGRVVFKLFTEPDEPAPDVEPPADPTA